jgi:hypothetical protein
MPYVVRNTFTPIADIERNWSAWIGGAWDSRAEAIEALMDEGAFKVEPAWFGLRHRDLPEDYEVDDLWRATDLEFARFLAIVSDRAEVDVRFNSAYGKWQHVHHDGLSCYVLDAETEPAAYAEATAGSFPWFGFGDATVGVVRYVGCVREDLHLFWCEDTQSEGGFC